MDRRLSNVVLVVLDALRADAIEPYGAPTGASPALAELARKGVVVDGVRSTAGWTLPSHFAMFTGRLARSVGLGQAPERTPQSAVATIHAHRDLLLAEVLRKAGYVTRGASTNMWCGRMSGFEAGFDSFQDVDTSRHGRLGGSLRDRMRWDWDAARARGDDGAKQVSAIHKEWLSEPDDRPFFWFTNILECHSPYLPPTPYHEAAFTTRLLAADEAFRYLTLEGILQTWLGVRRIPSGAVSRMRQLYAACVRYADAWVRELVATLAAHQQLENTLLIICADHGELFAERGAVTHGLSLDEPLVRVPLIAVGPGAEAFHGTRSLCELPARIASAVGLPQHPWTDQLTTGLAVSQWDPFPTERSHVTELAADWNLDAEAQARLTTPITTASKDRFKLVRGATRQDETVFDLGADPFGLQPSPIDSLSCPPDVLEELRSAVNHPDAQAAAPAKSSHAQPASPDETADLERRMRLLGYL